MLLPAEIESKSLIPALRAILAKDLAKKYNIREDEISRMLGVTRLLLVIIFVEFVVFLS
jgi:hypothetical protein